MVTRGTSFSTAKPSQTPPVKAKESLGSSSKKMGRKKADELIPLSAPPMTTMDLSNNEKFPKLPSASATPATGCKEPSLTDTSMQVLPPLNKLCSPLWPQQQ